MALGTLLSVNLGACLLFLVSMLQGASLKSLSPRIVVCLGFDLFILFLDDD